MEINRLRDNNTIYSNNGDVNINNGTINIYKVFEVITKKDNYLDFYKKYISKFDELRDYFFFISMPNYSKKKYEFFSDTLIFGKKLINWIYGLEEFPKNELNKFYNNIKDDFDFNNDTVILKRWRANIAYFSEDIELANSLYSELYDELEKNVDIPEWYLDDICIDARNLLILNNDMDYLKSKFQQKLNSNRHKISYPYVDRIKAEIFDNLSNHIFNNKNKSKNTTILGIGLESFFNNIQELIFLTIFYGSITHLLNIRKLIAEVMFLYSDTFDDANLYKMTFRMLFLYGDYKKYYKLYYKIKWKYSEINSDKFIQSLIDAQKSLFSFKLNKSNIFLFSIYGGYYDDVLYCNIEKKIFDYINYDNKYAYEIVKMAFEGINRNIFRISDKVYLFKSIIEYLRADKNIFNIIFGKILQNIDVMKLKNEEFILYQNIVDLFLVKRNKINFTLAYFIINIKKRDSTIDKYDYIIFDESTDEYILYKAEIENNELEVAKSIVKKYEKSYNEIENTNGINFQIGYEYNLGNNIFEKEIYKDTEVRDFIINKYLPLAKAIILSEKETIYEKIKHIKLLTFIIFVEKDKVILKDIFDDVQKSQNISSGSPFFFDTRVKDKIDLEINIKMFDTIFGNISYDICLFYYLELALNNRNYIEEILDCILILKKYMNNNNEEILEKLYFIFCISFEEEDISIKSKAINISEIFFNTEYQEKIMILIEKDISNMIPEEVTAYVNLINNLKIQKYYIFSDLINMLNKNNNYNVRYFINNYLK